MMQEETPRPAIGYYLLSYGPKHSDILPALRPGVKSQAILVARYLKIANLELRYREIEYLRKPRCMDNFGLLFQLIEKCRTDPTLPALVVSDVSRIVGLLPDAQRVSMLRKLYEHVDLVHDARLGHAVSNIDPQRFVSLVRAKDVESQAKLYARLTWPPPPTQKDDTERSEQTKRARKKSLEIRAAKANDNASALAQVREMLERDRVGRSPSYREIADAANARGMSTTRGHPWTSTSVSRALKLSGPTSAD